MTLKQLRNKSQKENIQETAKELKSANYREVPQYGSENERLAAEIVLYRSGWKFDPEVGTGKPAYSQGWWYKPNATGITPTRRTGDSQDRLFGAWDAFRLYEAFNV